MGRHVSPYEQHPSQFGTGELREPPRITFGRVFVGILVAAAVMGAGYALRSASSPLLHCQQVCGAPDHPMGSDVPLPVWYGAGALLGGLVIGWPWVAPWVRRLLRRDRRWSTAARHPPLLPV